MPSGFLSGAELLAESGSPTSPLGEFTKWVHRPWFHWILWLWDNMVFVPGVALPGSIFYFLLSTFYYGLWSGMLFYRWMHLWHYAVGCLPSSPYWKVNGSTGYVHVSGVRYHWTIQTPQDGNKYSHHFSYYFSCCKKSHTIEHSSKNSFVVCDMWWMRSIYP